MTSREKIIKIVKEQGEISAKNITEYLGISKQRTHKLLKELIQSGALFKIGSPPRVLYKYANKERITSYFHQFTDNQKNILNDNFIVIEPSGTLLRGPHAFSVWCKNRDLHPDKTFIEYHKTLNKYAKYYDENGLINGTQKLQNTKELDLCIDIQFYADFYAIERFGKTKLGQLLHIGKISQNIKLIEEIVELTRSKLEALIHINKIDAIGYIPPTIKRDIQIMKQLDSKYNISLPTININKIMGEIVIPQKALSKIRDRIINARTSITINDRRKFKNVLLIDDALGSGATINETACKLKKMKLAQKVFGFAVTGSYKGFEVLSEA